MVPVDPIVTELTHAREALEAKRAAIPYKDDPRGRYLSIAITHIEDALLRLEAVLAIEAEG